ncbi:hypothetical protein ACGFZP_02730 [Kitasatospora sp. NPDC048239]|uniref:hypothetical protein n=1 Tax=unclassified Kitasatospora TaxID=2633591 RepID=UPI0037131516
MNTRPGSTRWEFHTDEDDMVIVEAPAGTDENLRLAIETLILPFGLSSDAPRTYLQEWHRLAAEDGTGYSLGTAAAGARRTGPDLVEIVDMYGQFEDCTIDARQFEAVLEGLTAYLDGA